MTARLRYYIEKKVTSFQMKRWAGVVFLVMVCCEIHAQSNFVELHGGKVVYGRSVRYKSPLFGKPYLLVDDSSKYEVSGVSNYQNQDGYFKRFTTDFSTPSFYRREIDGPKIQVYSKTLTYTSLSPGYGGVGIAVPMTNRTTLDYYIKDGLPPQRVSFRNLYNDLADNANSMAALHKVKKLRTLTGILYVAGTGLVLTGFSEMSSKQAAEPNKRVGISPLFIAGVVSFTVPVFLHAPKRAKLIEAVELYNK